MDAAKVAAIAAAAVAAGATSAPVVQPTVPGSVLLIDGDGLNYACAGNDDTSPSWARTRLLDRINGLKQACGAEQVQIHLTYPGSNKRHRYTIATVKPYQGKRASHRPKNWEFLRGVLEAMPEAKSWGDREADDGMAYAAAVHRGKVFIASADKDLRMVSGTHLNMETYEQVDVPADAWDVRAGDKQYGMRWFFLQMLMGDSVDNIPGLEKYVKENGKAVLCGEKTAEGILQYVPDTAVAAATVAQCYKDFYGDDTWADRMVEQAALLWLSPDIEARQWVPLVFLHHDRLRQAAHRLWERVHAPA